MRWSGAGPPAAPSRSRGGLIVPRYRSANAAASASTASSSRPQAGSDGPAKRSLRSQRTPSASHCVAVSVILLFLQRTSLDRERPMASELLARTAERYEASAAELERAAKHLRIAADHFRQGEVARGCAHALAVHGHMRVVQRQLDDHAEMHRTKAQV